MENLLQINTGPDLARTHDASGLLTGDPAFFIRAGGGYDQPWTRDASLNSWNAASLLEPQVARNTLWAVCLRGADGDADGSAGQPVVGQSDLDHRRVEPLRRHRRPGVFNGRLMGSRPKMTLAQMQREHYNRAYGLFEGPAFFADGIAGYPDQRFARAGSTYLVDALGSTVALATSGAAKTNYGYDPYGVSTATGTASTNTFQFTGRENDGTGLLAYRNRYYNPAWGRFVSEDPIGLRGGINVYAYVQGDPTDYIDPSGLKLEDGLGSDSGSATAPTRPTNMQVAGKDKPIIRCEGLSGITCGAPMQPGDLNPDYPKVCDQCLMREKKWPYGGSVPTQLQ